MIHLERVRLPDGLRALAYRDRNGNLVIYVSEGLDAKAQRAAVMEAIRASRRAGWRKTGLLPVGIAMALGIRALLQRAGRTVGARPVAWGAAATATAVGATAAGIFIASAPHPHGPSAAMRPGEPSTVQPSGQQAGGRTPHPRQAHPVAVARLSPGPGQPAASGQPSPASTSPGRPSPTIPAPGPEPSPTQPAPGPSPSPTGPAPGPSPSPSPAPSPSPTGGPPPGICVIVLGIKVCLPHVSVSLKV
ncbi:MAG TPA: hypothetical protein VH307_06500 [Streptosporangiaceae bacterium]|nr:hypothetical protein [Streptosporangiaceae bacterium]